MNPIGIHIASIAGYHLPPSVALVLTVGFVGFLFRRDIRERPNITGALWIPLLWMLITCSRAVSAWLTIFGLPIGAPSSQEEGSPLDAFVYFALIVAGFYVLNKRQINLSEIIQNNGWLIAFLLYCFAAIVWSDYPFVAFKRWIKILGLPIMALVLFTEPDFEEALARLMKRSAYVLVPFSILLIKYYPQIGRGFDQWTGFALNFGVAQGKNLLGSMCLILGFFFVWHLLNTRRRERSRARRNELFLIGGFLVMIGWLQYTARSATTLVCLLVSLLVMMMLGLRFVDKRAIAVYTLLAGVTLLAAELALGISGYIIELLHKDPTLSDRTRLWADILKIKINPILGVGFESFWLGDRLVQLHEGRAFQPNEAHNGYLETYVNLGLIGLFMLVAVIIAAYRKICRGLLTNFQFGRFRLGFLVAIVLYNGTEASFRGLDPLWFVFYIIALDYPRVEYEPLLQSSETARLEDEMEPVYLAE